MLWIWVYILAALGLWIPLAVVFVLDEKRKFPSLPTEFDDYAAAALFGGMAAAFWPLALVALGVIRAVQHIVEAEEHTEAHQ